MKTEVILKCTTKNVVLIKTALLENFHEIFGWLDVGNVLNIQNLTAKLNHERVEGVVDPERAISGYIDRQGVVYIIGSTSAFFRHIRLKGCQTVQQNTLRYYDVICSLYENWLWPGEKDTDKWQKCTLLGRTQRSAGDTFCLVN